MEFSRLDHSNTRLLPDAAVVSLGGNPVRMDQRLVGLAFAAIGGVLHAKAPANGHLAPPGYNLLFILNKEGVPSVARFVHLS